MEDKSKEYWLEIIYDSLSGNITDETQKELDTWMLSSAKNQAFYNEIVELYTLMDFSSPNEVFNANAAYQQFLSRKHKTVYSFRQKVLPYISVAAGLLIAFTLGNYWTKDQQLPTGHLVSTITVEKGSKTKTVLQDGSVVWLNSDTELEVASDFGISERRIKITGEAFFEVTHDDEAPFIVETSGLDVQVHGTSFNVSCYPEQHDIRVTLVEGSVELSSKNGKTFRMQPSQTVIYDAKEKSYTLIKGIPDYELAWRESKFIFKNKKFSELTVELERIFDVQIQVNDKALLNRKLTGDFINNEGIAEILEVMSSLGKFSYKINGRQIEIF
ncbi:DUF4974 domain-containing protein [Sphingobacterium alkalisoli]|uniref:DUF4974 domain-containing protein n=2 Tax=Sphingobacterium TaxID=28453 RepID=A0A4U0PDA3_9SPHI|nr:MULTISPECIES: FecR domain-containing protein [Sphingobacterium]TJY64339.1 DUF4974 domain-containing protein [Sphingobacterium alkalisoli]TJZ60644.1 DUF4974 domain-containing protein [Sphingobacterium olei]GGH22336.1 anti-sigma factor [Sphingobacterium alkalisoli]